MGNTFGACRKGGVADEQLCTVLRCIPNKIGSFGCLYSFQHSDICEFWDLFGDFLDVVEYSSDERTECSKHDVEALRKALCSNEFSVKVFHLQNKSKSPEESFAEEVSKLRIISNDVFPNRKALMKYTTLRSIDLPTKKNCFAFGIHINNRTELSFKISTGTNAREEHTTYSVYFVLTTACALSLDSFIKEKKHNEIIKRIENPVESLKNDVTSALQIIHEKGYVHRDIKPDNIVYCLDTNSFKLIDFGLMAKAGSIKCAGTYAYMSKTFIKTICRELIRKTLNNKEIEEDVLESLLSDSKAKKERLFEKYTGTDFDTRELHDKVFTPGRDDVEDIDRANDMYALLLSAELFERTIPLSEGGGGEAMKNGVKDGVVKYNGRMYTIAYGSRGGAYIVVGKEKRKHYIKT